MRPIWMNERRKTSRARARSPGLCPVTEANLGDGIFNAADYLRAGGRYGVGTDSNVSIGVAAELRQLEYGQRLRERARNVCAPAGGSTGRAMLEAILSGGAHALQRRSGRLALGALADLVTFRADHPTLAGKADDEILDAWIFSAGNALVDCVWSGGRKVVVGGRHVFRDQIAAQYAKTNERTERTALRSPLKACRREGWACSRRQALEPPWPISPPVYRALLGEQSAAHPDLAVDAPGRKLSAPSLSRASVLIRCYSSRSNRTRSRGVRGGRSERRHLPRFDPPSPPTTGVSSEEHWKATDLAIQSSDDYGRPYALQGEIGHANSRIAERMESSPFRRVGLLWAQIAAISSTAWRKGSNQPFAAAFQELGARLLQPVRGSPPLSSEVWRSERRLQSLLAAGSQRPDIVACPPIGPLAPCVFSGAFDLRKEISVWHSGAVGLIIPQCLPRPKPGLSPFD